MDRRQVTVACTWKYKLVQSKCPEQSEDAEVVSQIKHLASLKCCDDLVAS